MRAAPECSSQAKHGQQQKEWTGCAKDRRRRAWETPGGWPGERTGAPARLKKKKCQMPGKVLLWQGETTAFRADAWVSALGFFCTFHAVPLTGVEPTICGSSCGGTLRFSTVGRGQDVCPQQFATGRGTQTKTVSHLFCVSMVAQKKDDAASCAQPRNIAVSCPSSLLPLLHPKTTKKPHTRAITCLFYSAHTSNSFTQPHPSLTHLNNGLSLISKPHQCFHVVLFIGVLARALLILHHGVALHLKKLTCVHHVSLRRI